MIEIGRRARTQAPPPRILFESLMNPERGNGRPWLTLRDDEIPPLPRMIRPDREVEWTSIWTKRPDAIVRFELVRQGEGTNLIWTLFVDEPAPDAALTGHLRKRLNELINANLRYTFGQ